MTTTYRLLIDGTWQSLYRAQGAVTRSLAPIPGVVWKRAVELSLPVGTEIERIVESPRREAHVNTSDVLFGRSKGLRRDQRCTRYVVTAKGQLRPLKSNP